ncbi:hypothetical protein CYMTET_53713 [Cymbomonas tetramitiformis]|uniref:Uncharacterized protein n=1 Tax=Cymbomonas tetramitiformis TaxID=36881 RepID=A0AAE0EQA5_9CHLO|nr:hypothetical protein CYMTET_53713 [Cymbomonas tetramitiformis]
MGHVTFGASAAWPASLPTVAVLARLGAPCSAALVAPVRWAKHGHDWLPLELVSLDSNTRYYPVEDGLGGPGRVFADNAAAQEYLRLGEYRRMLKWVNTEQEGYAAIRADAARRPPPPHDTMITKRVLTQPPEPAVGAGPSRAAAESSRATAGPSRARSLSPGSSWTLESRRWPFSCQAAARIACFVQRGLMGELDQGPAWCTSTFPKRRAFHTFESGSDAAATPVPNEGTSIPIGALKDRSNLTVFMVKFGLDLCRGRKVMYELGVCFSERGLRLRTHPGVSNKVARKHDKTISCGRQGWRLPLGGQTASSSLLEAVTSAYADLMNHGSGSRREGQHARNVVGSLCAYVERGSAHVLRCMEHPHAKPVYYIFQNQDRCLRWQAQFTNEYLMRDDRKFTQLLWGTKSVAAPWVLAALESLEAHLFSGAAPSALQARVAERPEHVDEMWTRNVDEVRDHPARQRRQPSGSVAERRPDASSAARASAPSTGRHGTSSHVVSAPRASRLPAGLTLRQCSGLVVAGTRLDKPRFAARWAQLRRNLQLHRVAQTAYLVIVLALVVSTAAGGSSRLVHGGWRVMACFFASNSPVAAVRFNRILRFFLLLCGIVWVAGKLTESMPAHGVMSPTRSAWGASPCTSWEAQQSSRQWEPGWEANVAEQDEVLPYTVLDELQPLGDTTVTKDEAAWLDTELNATFGGHPDFKEEHWEEMRAVLRRCKSTFANSPHDLTGYKGKAEHNTFSIPFVDESKAAYQRPRKYSPGEQEIIDIHCKELLEYGFIEPAAKHCRHASNVVVAGKKDHETGLWTQSVLLQAAATDGGCWKSGLAYKSLAFDLRISEFQKFCSSTILCCVKTAWIIADTSEC